MKKVVLFDTSIGSFNQGDEIINRSLEKNWPELFGENYIIKLPTHTPLYTKFQQWIYKEKMEIITKADYKFLCGTNALYTNMLRPLPNWNIRLWNTALAKNTICVGVGIGINSPKVNIYTKRLFSCILSREYVHSTRDQKTCEFLHSLGYKAINTGCPTLWGMSPEHCVNIPCRKGKTVVCTLTSYSPDYDNDKAMLDILLHNYEVVYFWPQSIQDYSYLKYLCNSDRIVVISPNLTSYEKLLSDKEILGISPIDYVGSRLHGGIFALQHQCRAIIVSIDYRSLEMASGISLKTVKRNNIKNTLDELINSNWCTRLNGLDQGRIYNWKMQFDL